MKTTHVFSDAETTEILKKHVIEENKGKNLTDISIQKNGSNWEVTYDTSVTQKTVTEEIKDTANELKEKGSSLFKSAAGFVKSHL